MATTPSARSKQYLEKQGYEVGTVERWVPQAKRRIDLFGFLDLVAIGHGTILGIQSTSGSNAADRVSKILAEPRAKLWLQCGGKIEVHGWRKLKVKRGGKAVRWEARIVPVTLEDLEADAAYQADSGLVGDFQI